MGPSIVSGYRFNGLGTAQTGQPLTSSFEIDPAAVVLSRSQYGEFQADPFLTNGALSNKAPVPRLPGDAGYLLLEAGKALVLQGTVLAQGAPAFHGGLIDINILPNASMPDGLMIAGAEDESGFNGIVLNATELSQLGAESLLIGGARHFNTDGTTITVTTNNLTVNKSQLSLGGAGSHLGREQDADARSGRRNRTKRHDRWSADTLLLGKLRERRKRRWTFVKGEQ